jgi:predicted secreted protein
VSTSDGKNAPGTEPTAPRKVALVANCLLNQNAKVCQGAHYPGVVSPVVEALRRRGYLLQQLPCPELAFAGARRWWAVYEQYDTPAYRAHCRRLAQAIAPLIEGYLRRGDEVILIGLDGSPSTGVRFTSSKPDWGGRPNRPDNDWDIVPRRGIWIEELEAELTRRGLRPLPATGWALDMGRFDESGARRDLEEFLDSRGRAARAPDDDQAAR